MKHISKNIFYILVLYLSLACTNKGKLIKVDIFSIMHLDISIPVAVKPKMFEYIFKSDWKHCVILDNKQLTRVETLISEKGDKDVGNTIDIKAMCLLHYASRTDTLYINQFGDIMKNEKEGFVNKDFSSYIQSFCGG